MYTMVSWVINRSTQKDPRRKSKIHVVKGLDITDTRTLCGRDIPTWTRKVTTVDPGYKENYSLWNGCKDCKRVYLISHKPKEN